VVILKALHNSSKGKLLLLFLLNLLAFFRSGLSSGLVRSRAVIDIVIVVFVLLDHSAVAAIHVSTVTNVSDAVA